MESSQNSLYDLLTSVSLEVKSISKHVEHLTAKPNDELRNCIDIINKLIRELDHTVEKLETLKK